MANSPDKPPSLPASNSRRANTTSVGPPLLVREASQDASTIDAPPQALLPLLTNDDPLKEPLPTRWKDFFIQRCASIRRPDTVRSDGSNVATSSNSFTEAEAEELSEIFELNEMPPPNRKDVLLFAIDHDTLLAMGIRSVGRRSSIISACRLAAADHFLITPCYRPSISAQQQQPHQDWASVNRTHHASSHVHFPREVSDAFDGEGERRMFPVIYRNTDNGNVADASLLGDEDTNGSGIHGVGEDAVSEAGTTSSVGDQHDSQLHHAAGRSRDSSVVGGKNFMPHHHHRTDDDDDAGRPLLGGQSTGAATSLNNDHASNGKDANDFGTLSQSREGANTSKRKVGEEVASSEGGKSRDAYADDENLSQPHLTTQQLLTQKYYSELILDDSVVNEFVFESTGKHRYTWIDLVGRDPRRHRFQDRLKQIVDKYGFAEQLLLDIDLTLALPQLISCPNEPDQFLIILRVAAESSGGIEEDSLHLLTSRVMIAVNLASRAVVTIHRRDSGHMASLRGEWHQLMSEKSMAVLLCKILDDGLLSYVDAIHDSESLLDQYEALMLKHSVGADTSAVSSISAWWQRLTSSQPPSAAVAFPTDNSFASPAMLAPINGSFAAEERPSLFSRIFGCCAGNSVDDDVKSRRGGGGGGYDKRLRNKEYQVALHDSATFTRQKMNQLLYHLHRRCSVYNRMLTLTQTTLEVSYSSLKLASPEYAEQVGRSCGELAMKAETLHDNCQNLLNLHLSLVSFRTNELMNLLTVYSALFIPTTFVCSVYGMNFVNMPELELEYGYFYCWAFMVGMATAIMLWFKKRGFV